MSDTILDSLRRRMQFVADTVSGSGDDPLAILNSVRLDFTPTEAVAIGRTIESREQRNAANRQRSRIYRRG